MKSVSAQKLIALSLVIFLSGACCLLCAVPLVIAAVHCPLERSAAHCDKKVVESSKSPSVTRENQNIVRCPFLLKRSELAQKPNVDAGAVAVKAAGISSSTFFISAKNYTFPHSYRSVIRDRGSTYLANCVFRI